MLFSQAFAAAAALLPIFAVASPTTSNYKRGCPTDATSYCPSICTPDDDTLETLFKAFNEQLWSGDAAGAYAKYVSPNFTEHSASVTDYQSGIAFLSALFPTVDVAVIAGLETCKDGRCLVHYKATPGPNGSPFINNVTVISDIFRYDGSCIVEHWDALQTADASTTNPLFPGN